MGVLRQSVGTASLRFTFDTNLMHLFGTDGNNLI